MAVDFDVTSLHHRRATHRWERTSVGDLLERMTWSFPDQEALVGRAGAYADPAFRRLTYRQADQLADQIAHALLARGLGRGDIVMLFCENSIEGYLVKIGAARRPGLRADQPDDGPGHGLGHDPAGRAQARDRGRRVLAARRAPFAAHGLEVAVTITIGGGPVPGSVSFSDFVAPAGQRAGRRDPGPGRSPACAGRRWRAGTRPARPRRRAGPRSRGRAAALR